MKYVLVALVLMAVPISAANAADVLPGPAPAPRAYVAPVSPAYNWSGFYVGAMGGFGWWNSSGNDFKGGFAGGTVGANMQMQNIVLGVEADGGWSNIGQSITAFGATASTRIGALASLTGRVGFAVDNFLLYGKAGGALASNRINIVGFGGPLDDTQLHFGYTAGGGVEYGFAPNWSAKGEYMYSHFESKNYFAPIIPAGVASGTFDVHTVKFGVNYRFGWGGAPVTAKY